MENNINKINNGKKLNNEKGKKGLLCYNTLLSFLAFVVICIGKKTKKSGTIVRNGK
jgi:hypothetical protein